MKCLITGITGTLGQQVSRILLQDEENTIVGVSRDEQKQRAIKPNPRLHLKLGDIRDLGRMLELTADVDLIFHFAALKCVDTLESNVSECINTNIIGTKNIVYAQTVHNISRIVLSSTDKACYPVNVYGHSKAVAEKLVLQNPNNVVCRYGNVLASRGSVIPAFVKTLTEEKAVYVTHPSMTRFFITIQDAAKFIIEGSQSETGGLKIPHMSSANICDVAGAVSEVLGTGGFNMKSMGIRAGEKIHECLQTQFEGREIFSNTADRFNHSELVSILTPVVRSL